MVLKLNIDSFIKLKNKNKLNMTEMADVMCISRAHLWRVLNNQCNPGEQFIAGFKKAFPEESFDEFFLVNMLQQNDTRIV
ncbi:hypothetical protein [Clostridium botulinum]|uniref:HTH cro/C1-type domain-containing protein n=1 Tax=Clostridium botulinum TaxID=1491 RepID=A0A6G4D2G6_CLOBO|nr:hypothetical protein [Clostridium botulinum]KEI87588.1 hypothetical protein N492_11585 [Clostridium botulinum B2 267]NFC47400.1 hypothetical protein [Clostridium botulinum]OSB08985.1 hypothetical protein B2H96_17500 [Clostridium botulinum]